MTEHARSHLQIVHLRELPNPQSNVTIPDPYTREFLT